MYKSEFCEVKKAVSSEEVLNKLSECKDSNTIVLNVFYTIAQGKREEFYKKINEEKIPQQSRLEEGNLKYEYYFPVESENQILLIEIWKDEASLNAHKEMEHFKELQIIKEEYVMDVKFEKYTDK